MLGPVLFNRFINNVDEGVESSVIKSADNTKLYRYTSTPEDRAKIRTTLTDRIYGWIKVR